MKNNVSLVLIVLLGIALRFWHLGSIPIELNRDEASIGYTAYSLLRTGADEYGRAWPLSVESFGDWKLPGYIWATIPSVSLFGLHPWSVRLPSAIAGVAAILLVYWLVFLLTKKSKHQQWLALIAALMLAVSPWHIHFSRMAYEVNLGTSALLLGVILLLRYFQSKQWWALLIGVAAFAYTLFTYHAFQIVSPVVLLTLAIVHFREWKLVGKHQIAVALVAVALFVVPVFLLLFHGAAQSNEVKLSGLTILDERTYYDRLFQKRQYFADQTSLAAKLYSNIPLEFSRQFQQNILTALTSNFLFLNGGGHGSHDIVGIGKFYSVLLPFMVLGAIRLFSKQRIVTKQARVLLLIWLGIAMVPAVITWEPAHATRLYATLLPLTLLCVQGFYFAAQLLGTSHRVRIFVFSVVGLVAVFQFITTQLTYFVVAPQRDVANWVWYAKDMARFLNEQQTSAESVYVSGNSWSPYIYYLFYNAIDPNDAQTYLVHAEPTDEGFQHVTSYKNILFGDVPYQHLIEAGTSFAVFAPTKELPADYSATNQRFTSFQVLSQPVDTNMYAEIVAN